jgi:transposase
MEPARCANCQSLQQRAHDLQAETERPRRQLDAALRAGKRQAGPFAKGEPKPSPRKPGRKPGQDYGTKAQRLPPTPDLIHEVAEALGVSSRTAPRRWVAALPRPHSLLEREQDNSPGPPS